MPFMMTYTSMVSLASIHIETAKVDDLDEVLKLCYLAYQSEAKLYADWSIPPLRETYAELRAMFDTSVVLVASAHDGAIVGSVRGHRRGDIVEIGRLVVHPRVQRMGLGTRLLSAIECQFSGITYELFTGSRSLNNIPLYQRHGYREVRRQELLGRLITVVMQKVGTAGSN